jgi:low affinity Fe/Cu permease
VTEPAVPDDDLARESPFEKVADWVSAAMGRPTNIMVWLVLVIAWTAIFAFGGSRITAGTWLPAWFTSQGFNFPLNLITTVAELFIGFLVAAASNRSERNLKATLAAIQAAEDRDEEMEKRNAELGEQLSAAVAVNTDLTQQSRDLIAANNSMTEQVAGLVRELHAKASPPA